MLPQNITYTLDSSSYQFIDIKWTHLLTIYCVRCQKFKDFGHVTCHNGLEKTIMQGMVAGKRSRGSKVLMRICSEKKNNEDSLDMRSLQQTPPVHMSSHSPLHSSSRRARRKCACWEGGCSERAEGIAPRPRQNSVVPPSPAVKWVKNHLFTH